MVGMLAAVVPPARLVYLRDMAQKPVAYCYSGCGTCRKALAWLSARGVECDVLPIRETPPSKALLREALDQGVPLKGLFNVSGGDYKELGMKDKLPGMSVAEALDLLASRGNLVKRPFVKTADRILVGFSEDAWAEAFPERRRS